MRVSPEKLRMLVLAEPLEGRTLLSGGIRGFVIDQNAGNTGISGITVFLDEDYDSKFDAGEQSVVTDANGVYQFTNLPAGLYYPREIVPSDYELVYTDLYGYSPTVLVEDGFESNGGKFVNLHYWVVKGTGDGDIITVKGDPAGARVTLNGVSDVRDPNLYKGLILSGGDGNDQIRIDSQLSILGEIFGGDGNDTLFGGAGSDSINGGSGSDSIRAGGGNDSVKGGGGRNVIHGGVGNDAIEAASGSAAGRSTVLGEAGNDKIDGGRRNDRLVGGDGDDTISGEGGNDILVGGAGDDHFFSADWSFSDLVSGGIGMDSLTRDGRDDSRDVEDVTRAHRPSGGGGFVHCFLTSAVVHWAGKTDDCHELTTLRRFRDGYMRGLSDGEAMIGDYYAHAPRVVRSIEEQKLGEQEWPKIYQMVQKAVRLIEAGDNREALKLYAAEYLRLKAEYL